MRAAGFSLIELAIVLVAAGLLVSSLLVPLAAQTEARKVAATRRTLNDARDAMLGFAIAFGRLPCPARESDRGIEAGGGGGPCTGGGHGAATGYIPAITLSLSPSDDQGYLLDAWGGRLRYAVSAGPGTQASVFTDSEGMRLYWQSNSKPPPSSLQICSDAAHIHGAGSAKADCDASSALTKTAVAVIYSTGRNSIDNASAADAAANRDNDAVFVAHEPRGAAGDGGAFEDQLLWLAPGILYHRLVAAGRLP